MLPRGRVATRWGAKEPVKPATSHFARLLQL
jgi:hypothetical protein